MDGRLSERFVGVGAKRLSRTEATSAGVSNGHELAASGPVLEMLGRARSEFRARYFYFADDDYLEDDSTITLYDAREHQPHRTPEWRLYYPAGCQPMEAMRAGDWCWIALDVSGDALVVVATADSSAARQFDRLFGTSLRRDGNATPDRAGQFAVSDLADAGDEAVDLDDANLLQALGITPAVGHAELLPQMIERFGGTYPMPSVNEFTNFAREVTQTADPLLDPDRTLYDWFTTTNDLFFRYERHVLQPVLDAELATGEHIDVDKFFELATRFKNSRFSRAGKSFEQHISALLEAHGLMYGSPPRMADGSKPDFLFPTIECYYDGSFPDELLTFLAAKTTTKERWRQVVTEATRSDTRYLITMDKELNADVLDAMGTNGVLPVVPAPVQEQYYPDAIRSRVLTVRQFLEVVDDRQQVAVDTQTHRRLSTTSSMSATTSSTGSCSQYRRTSQPLASRSSRGLRIAGHVARNLGRPEVRTGLRLYVVKWATMPEAPVDHHCHPGAAEDDVRRPAQLEDGTRVDPVPEAMPVQTSPNQKLGLRVASPGS